MTCRCDRPLRDTNTYCDHCATRLDRALGDVPSVADELETSLTGQRAITYGGTGGKAAATGLPWNDQAAEALRHLRALLVSWVKLVSEEDLPPAGRPLPRDTPASMARWMQHALGALQQHPAGPDAVAEIAEAVEAGSRVIGWRRRTRLYLGPCAYGQSGDGECAGDVYANEGADVGYCEACGAGLTVVIRQAELDDDLASRKLSAAEIADWAVRMGLTDERARTKKLVLNWHSRGRISPVDHVQTPAARVPLFRYGDVRELLAAACKNGGIDGRLAHARDV